MKLYGKLLEIMIFHEALQAFIWCPLPIKRSEMHTLSKSHATDQLIQ